MKFLYLLPLLFLIASCATIFTGTKDDISFDTNANPVKVYVDGLYEGETPITISVSRKMGRGRTVTLKKDGFKTQKFELRHKFNWVAVLDITSIITSGGIDVLTGAVMKYSPKHYHIEMVKKGTSSKALIQDSKQIQFARFVLINASEIQRELAVGNGPMLDNLIALGTTENTSQAFSQWLSDNTQELMSADNPEALLKSIRASGMTS